MRPTRRTFVAATALAASLLVLAFGVALAAGTSLLNGKVITGNQVTVPADQTVGHDLYLFGGTVDMNGTVNGDLTVAGGTINVNGPVNGDVFAAGGTVNINGPVKGDVRVAGGQLNANGQVTEDLAMAGGSLSVGGQVGGDLLVTGGDLALNGQVAGSTGGNVANYSKNGSVGGSDGITVNPYQSRPITGPAAPTTSTIVFDAARQFVAVLLIAILVLWFWPRLLVRAETEVREKPVPAIGWGFAALVGYIVLIVVVVIAMIILAIIFGILGFGGLLWIDIVGAIVAILGATLFYVVAGLFLADAIVGLTFARWAFDRYGRSGAMYGAAGAGGPAREWYADLGLIAAGVVAVVVLTSLPGIGWLFKLLVVVLGLGSLWLAWRRGGMTGMRTMPAMAGGPMPTMPVPPAPPMAAPDTSAAPTPPGPEGTPPPA